MATQNILVDAQSEDPFLFLKRSFELRNLAYDFYFRDCFGCFPLVLGVRSRYDPRTLSELLAIMFVDHQVFAEFWKSPSEMQVYD